MLLMKMMFLGAAIALVFSVAFAEDCLTCHKKVTPNIVSDWQISRHSQNDVDCSTCHGELHKTSEDFAKAAIPTPDTCAACHEEKVAQFKKGKHAFA